MGFLSNLFNGVSSLFSGGGGGNIGSSLMNMFGGGGGGGQQVASAMGQPVMSSMTKQGAQGGGNFLNSIFKNPGAGATGLGIMGLGQTMNKPAKFPDFNQDPAVQQLMGWQNSASHPLDPNVQASVQNSLNIQNEQRLRNLRDVYKNLRPGTDYTTDSNYQRDLGNLNRSISMDNADAMASQQFKSNEQQLGNLTNMAQLGVGSRMGQAAIDAEGRNQQNELFGNLGNLFLQQGIGQPDFMSMFKPYLQGKV